MCVSRGRSFRRLLFGTAGIPKSTPGSATIQGIQRVAELGLDCLEIEFVKGVRMHTALAEKIRSTACACGVKLSVHAPYYINLNSREEGKRLASQERLLNAARWAERCGAESVVFHCGYYGKDDAEIAYQKVREGIKEVVSVLKAERSRVVLRPETMGKQSQFGSLEEVLRLCKEVEGLMPCVDFGHLHARAGLGTANSYKEFNRIFRKIARKLGKRKPPGWVKPDQTKYKAAQETRIRDEGQNPRSRASERGAGKDQGRPHVETGEERVRRMKQAPLKYMHIHVSGVEYDEKGEKKHVNLNQSDFRYEEWIQALKDAGIEGMVICESPVQERDALMLKSLFRP